MSSETLDAGGKIASQPSTNFAGYQKKVDGTPDLYLTQVRRGTPGGEYLRRFWQPVAYVNELRDVPLKVRALGEDLVVFTDKSGRHAALHAACCHRNTSLEYAVIEERGIRCCYHGRLFDIDGTILEMPGEPEHVLRNTKVRQGAYPTHAFGGILFVYMGPPEQLPVFPMLDRFSIPGIELIPGERWSLKCNWLQIQENTLDPAHTATLHAIPQIRGMDHFAAEFGNFPELITWSETPAGYMYLAARHVQDRVWVRSAETIGANMRCISSIFETGDRVRNASLPFMTFWILPVDDNETCNFYISHVSQNEPIPFDVRRNLEGFGQRDDRPYHDRQLIPGDHEAQTGQGPINNHSLENLATMDRGIVLFRRYLRANIQRVEQGEIPHGMYFDQNDVPPTFSNDFVTSDGNVGGNPDDRSVLQAFCERLVQNYIAAPPMQELKA